MAAPQTVRLQAKRVMSVMRDRQRAPAEDISTEEYLERRTRIDFELRHAQTPLNEARGSEGDDKIDEELWTGLGTMHAGNICHADGDETQGLDDRFGNTGVAGPRVYQSRRGLDFQVGGRNLQHARREDARGEKNALPRVELSANARHTRNSPG